MSDLGGLTAVYGIATKENFEEGNVADVIGKLLPGARGGWKKAWFQEVGAGDWSQPVLIVVGNVGALQTTGK